MEKLRWGYIGSGSIAATVAANTEKRGHKIGAIYSRNKITAEKFGEKYEAEVFDDIDEFLNSENFDAVYIATPHTSHCEYAVKALNRKIPVLCEKPVGINEKEVSLMIETAKANETYFAEAMWTWFSPVAYEVKKWIDEKRIGKIKKVKIIYAFPGMLQKPTSRVRDPKTAGGALLDIGIYPITYCYRLFGYPKAIKCRGKIKNGIDVSDKIILSYEGFDCEISLSLYKLNEGMYIKGEKGRIDLPIFHVARTVTLKSKSGKEIYTGKTDYLTEFDRCAEEIKEGKKQSDFVPFSSTAATMKIMDECRRQMKLVYPVE